MICNQILENVNIFQEDGLGKRNLLHFLTHNFSICSKLGNKMNAQKDARDSKFSCYVQKVAKQLKVPAFSRNEILRFIGLGNLV